MDFYLHDVSDFPFVALRSDRCPPGFAAQWGSEMNALLDSGRMFVVAFEPEALSETPEDFRTRGVWFKKNRHLLAGRCAAMIAIVPDAQVRADNATDMAKRSRGFDVLYCAMATVEEARESTNGLIADARQAMSRVSQR